MFSDTNLTACIVCGDQNPESRIFKLVKLLLDSKKFNEVYLVSSTTKPPKQFAPKDITAERVLGGQSISRDRLPQSVAVAFVHDSDTEKLWKPVWTGTDRKAQFVFKFTTSGDPDVEGEELPICRKNEEDNLGIAASDIEEVVAYVTQQRKPLPSICFPAIELSKKQEIVSPKQRQIIWERLFSWLKKYDLKKMAHYEGIYHLIGWPKPTIYVFDDYNNYILFEEGVYTPNPHLTEEVAIYYCGAEKREDFQKEVLAGFCLMLNNLSLAFTVKAPPLWIPNTQAGYDLISAALPLAQIERDRAQIAAFIVDLEWLPTLTDYAPDSNTNDRQQWRKMGRLCVDILSQLYPEIPSFIFTGLQPAEELQDGLSRGASWGFQKERSHHYSREQATTKQLSEQLTYINLERHLSRFVEVRYGSYPEVPFPNQLKLDPNTPAGQQLIKQLGIEQSASKAFQRQTLQKLIATLFPAANFVEPVKVLTTGKSKAEATFFVSPTSGQDKLATRFIKIGPWLSVQKEYLAYQRVIQPRLNSYTASLIHKPVLATGENNQMPKGALMYSLAGFPEDHKNLRALNELFEQHLEKPGGDRFLLDRLRNTLEEVLLPLYQAGTSKPSKKQPLWRWLGDVLPPLYTGALVPLPLISREALDEQTTTAIVLSSQTVQGYKDTAAWTLASFALTQLNFHLETANLECQKAAVQEPSHWDDEILQKPYKQVLLSGWYLSAIEWQEGDLGSGSITLVHPDLGFKVLLRGRGEDIRLRFGATWIRPGMSVKVLACLDATNQELEKIKRKINENLSSLNWLTDAANHPSADVFEYILSNFKQANNLSERLTSPLKVFGNQSILPHHYTIPAHAGPIHGDLNLNNILYPANETVGWLIDFELVKEQGMIAFDLAKLEVEIWNHHLSPYLAVLATLSRSSHASRCYQLLCWSLQALDFLGDETEFFITKVRSDEEFSAPSDVLLIPISNALKIIKAIRRFGLEQCKLMPEELKWALAAYFFNAVKFPSQTKKFKASSGCTAVFAFLASAWHLDAVLPNSKSQA